MKIELVRAERINSDGRFEDLMSWSDMINSLLDGNVGRDVN